jgi:hypothetical protein
MLFTNTAIPDNFMKPSETNLERQYRDLYSTLIQRNAQEEVSDDDGSTVDDTVCAPTSSMDSISSETTKSTTVILPLSKTSSAENKDCVELSKKTIDQNKSRSTTPSFDAAIKTAPKCATPYGNYDMMGNFQNPYAMMMQSMYGHSMPFYPPVSHAMPYPRPEQYNPYHYPSNMMPGYYPPPLTTNSCLPLFSGNQLTELSHLLMKQLTANQNSAKVAVKTEFEGDVKLENATVPQ